MINAMDSAKDVMDSMIWMVSIFHILTEWEKFDIMTANWGEQERFPAPPFLGSFPIEQVDQQSDDVDQEFEQRDYESRLFVAFVVALSFFLSHFCASLSFYSGSLVPCDYSIAYPAGFVNSFLQIFLYFFEKNQPQKDLSLWGFLVLSFLLLAF